MRKLLRIGEVAQLLGVTTKTIRHYHKIGLLQEPERTAAGYRLYNTEDLQRLHRIRHLQSLGLPLREIGDILGKPDQQLPLQEILQALDTELTVQIEKLEARRQNIRNLLQQETLAPIINQQPDVSKTLTWLKELLGERAARISPQVLEMEAQVWAAIDYYQWPDNFGEQMRKMFTQLASHPDLIDRIITFYDDLLALSTLNVDDPALTDLVNRWAESADISAFFNELVMLGQQVSWLETPFADILSEMMVSSISPAQQRFFTELIQRQSFFQHAAQPDGQSPTLVQGTYLDS